MAKYLVDTCVWRDFFEERRNRYGGSLAEPAASGLMRILSMKSEILICREIVRELRMKFTREEIESMFRIFEATGQLKWIEPGEEEIQEARRISRERNIPFTDCVLAVFARSGGAIVVTRDHHFFSRLADVIEAKRPEELG
jgi:predicted nucleic acid-binding protein